MSKNKNKIKEKFNIKAWEPEYQQLKLRFTTYAWEKIVHLNSMSYQEVGAFGLSNKDDLLLVEDIAVIKQDVGGASVKFDDDAVADHFEDQYDLGRQPVQCGRIWIHTHPNWAGTTGKGNSPSPSGVDESTFEAAFGNCNWAIMFIYGGGKCCYARLAIKNELVGQIKLPVLILKGKSPSARVVASWTAEYNAKVTESTYSANLMGFHGLADDDLLYVEDDSYLGRNHLTTRIDQFKRPPETFEDYIRAYGMTLAQFNSMDPNDRTWWHSEWEREKLFVT